MDDAVPNVWAGNRGTNDAKKQWVNHHCMAESWNGMNRHRGGEERDWLFQTGEQVKKLEAGAVGV